MDGREGGKPGGREEGREGDKWQRSQVGARRNPLAQGGPGLLSHIMCSSVSLKSHVPHKTVKLISSLVIVNNKLTIFGGS